MEKRFLAIVLIIAGLCACEKRGGPSDRAASLNVKVRIGVVMKSGDVKRVARQDVLVTKADIIALWTAFEVGKVRDHLQIEQEVKRETNYDAKLSALQEAMSQLRGSDASSLAQGVDRLRRHVEKTYQDGMAYGVSAPFNKFRYEPSEMGERAYRNDLEAAYSELMKRDLGQGAKSFLAIRYAEFREICRLFPDAQAVRSEVKRRLDDLARERREFVDAFNNKVSERERVSFEKAKTEFLQKVREAFVLSFKTDLEGEASVAMPKGRHFLFCDADIALSHITWSCLIEVNQEGQSIELSNDNAAAIDKEEVAQLISTIGSSGTK